MQNGSLRGPRDNILPNAIIQDDDDGRTALHDASIIGDEKSVNTLLNGGVDRNAKDTKHGNTALHEAAWRGYSRCVKLLCSLPPSTSKNHLKEGKLKGALQETRNALHSALLGTRNVGGFSALHLAAQNGHNQSCREILLAGADPDVQNNYGDTALHTACRYGHAGATRILISANCDPNRTNLNGDTPLHISCAMGRRKLTRILLEAGSSIEIKNAQNETPLNIANRKKLKEILDILNTPIKIKLPKPNDECDKLTNNNKTKTKMKGDKVDGKTSAKSNKSTKKPNKSEEPIDAEAAHPVNWSPYGCHYFPDPRTFPSPKLETLPKEPLTKGEQYFLDLAGNIRKGPVGVGNTCYCGPFFRDIEQKITKNRKSIRKYVFKATERLDNKVQALALKTDDQIEQLTRSMMADRIRCEGRRLHLEDWIKRGDPLRGTTGGVGIHHSKCKKNLDNTNTLTRCKSLELLGEDDDSSVNHKMTNSRSFDVLDGLDIIIHRDAESVETDNPRVQSSLLSSERKVSRNSERSRSTGDDTGHSSRKQYNQERNSVSDRLEELLAKTNKILEMEKIARRRRKQALQDIDSQLSIDKLRKKSKIKDLDKHNSKHALYNKNLFEKLKRTTYLGNMNNNHSNSRKELHNTEFIAMEMEKITSSLAPEKPLIRMDHLQFPSNRVTPEARREYSISQKERDRKCDLEHERSSTMSGASSHKIPSSTGSPSYNPNFPAQNSNLRVNRAPSRPSSASISNKSIGSNGQKSASPLALPVNYNQDYQNITEVHDIDAEKKFKDLITALRKDYNATKLAINSEIYKDSQQNHEENVDGGDDEDYEDDEDNDEDEDEDNVEHEDEEEEDDTERADSQNYENSDHCSQEHVNMTGMVNEQIIENGFFQNEDFDDSVVSSANNTMISEKRTQKNSNDPEETTELSDMAKTSEINELKSRILNGSNWRSQVLKESQQMLNSSNNNNVKNSENITSDKSSSINLPEASVNGIVKQFEIKNSEIKALTSSCNLRRSKVQELVAKIQGVEITSPVHYQADLNGNDMDSESSDEEEEEEEVKTPHSPHHQNGDPMAVHIQDEQYYYYNRAQPQVATPNYPLENGHLIAPTQNSLAIRVDPRILIPKDAYFHELPNKNRMRPIVDKLPEKQMLKFIDSTSNSNYNQNIASPTLVTARTRNPLPYLHEYINEIPLVNGTSNSHNQFLEHPNYSNVIHHPNGQINNNNYEQQIPPLMHRNVPHPEKLLSNRKFAFSNAVDYELSRINYNQQQQQLQQQQGNTVPNQPVISITPEQAQFERDLSNDSGFSTKICGSSSHGPSPSLSGHTDYGVMGNTNTRPLVNGNGINNNHHHTHHHPESNGVSYFIGNTSSLV